jgi:hypothetical protein
MTTVIMQPYIETRLKQTVNTVIYTIYVSLTANKLVYQHNISEVHIW